MTNKKPEVLAVLDKFAREIGANDYEELKRLAQFGGVSESVEKFECLASLTISETQKEMIATLEKHKNDITNNEAELNFGFNATLMWLKRKYGVK